MKKLLSLVILLVCVNSQAGLLAEFGGTYISDNLKSSSTISSTEYFYHAAVLFNIQKDIWGGWNYSGISLTTKSDNTTTFSAMDTGPYVKWQFGRGDIFNLAMAYHILSRATFSDGTTTENWEGTSMWFQFGVAPEIRNNLRVGVSLNYYLASYTKKTVSSVESSASNSKTWIFPLLSISKSW